MNDQQKKEWVWNRIKEREKISRRKFLMIKLEEVLDYEASDFNVSRSPIIFPIPDQVNILRDFEKKDLITFLSFDNSTDAFATFVTIVDFTSESEQEKVCGTRGDVVLSVETIGGVFSIDRTSGVVTLGSVQKEYSLASRNFDIILKLIKNQDHTVSFAEILKSDISKNKRRAIGFNLRDLKGDLGILPKKNRKNIDIFKNVKGYGYRIILKNKD